MKKILKKIVVSIISLESKLVLFKYKPRIILVTGSVGKTATKDAIATVLSDHFFVRASAKSYNSETGVPLTILGCKNPWDNHIAWLKVIIEGLMLILFPNHYPTVLVLEVGADSPGGIKRLTRWIYPEVVVVTKLPEIPVHVEFYSSPSETREEEFSPAHKLIGGGHLIYNRDDEYAHTLALNVAEDAKTFGYHHTSDVRIAFAEILQKEEFPDGLSIKIAANGSEIPININGVFGTHNAYAIAAALTTASVFDINIIDATKSFADFSFPPGRGKILQSKDNIVIIDDTYNSSPVAVTEALNSLKKIETKARKVLVLGDMLELGTYTAAEHVTIGALAGEVADILVTVGVRAKGIYDAALTGGIDKQKIFHTENSQKAIELLKDILEAGDLVFVKGSQGMRLERVVSELLPDNADKENLLVRQDTEWLKKP